MKMYQVILSSIALQLGFSSVGSALPLLGETAGTIKYGHLTLYKDHQDPKKLYYFPNSTKFARDEKDIPLFNMVTWGVNDPAATDVGGYFSMTTNLTSSTDQQKQLDQFQKDHPDMEIAVIPVKSSLIGLQTTKKDAPPLGMLFDEFNFAKVGGRAEYDIGVNAVLTKTGAKAFSALLKNIDGGSPLKMDYCYKFQGFGPNMDAEIKVDFKRVYSYFEANGGAQVWWVRVDIRTVVEKLQQEGSISIKMNGGDAKMWEYLQTVSDEITKRLFKPELSASAAGMAQSSYPWRLSVNSVQKTELKTETWFWKRTDLEEREFCTAINIKDLGPYRKKLITETDKN